MSGACAALYFLNLKGDVLISRVYRDDVDRSLTEDVFKTHIVNSKEKAEGPVLSVAGVSFIWMRHSNVYLVMVTTNNANVMLAMKFLSQVITLFKSYFGGECNEHAIKNNFVLIYELLDEINDFGYPQVLDPMILKQYIFQEGFLTDALSSLRRQGKDKDKDAKNATLQVTGAVGWRKEGIRYKKNEVFLDVVEKVNLLMSSKGSVLRCDVVGQILMKCFLSGMPDLKLGLNDKLEDNSITFHPCVNLGRFSTERVVSFVPPDGEFELLKYRCQEGISLPFRVIPIVKEYGRTRIEINVKVKSSFNSKLFALNVAIRVPVPKHTAKANMQVTVGKTKYDAAKNELVWKIKRFTGQTEHSLSAEVELVALTSQSGSSWSKPPIKMDFQVPMFSASGLRVQYLKVWEKSSYKVDKWVRKISKSGDYDIRM